MDKKFIITDDGYAIDQLYKAGFQLVNINAEGMHTFFNDTNKKLCFSKDIKIYYTNKLNL